MNILACPTHKIEDRKTIVERVLLALQDDPDCRYSFKGEWKQLTVDQQANWDARQTLTQIKQTFHATASNPLEVSHVIASDSIAQANATKWGIS